MSTHKPLGRFLTAGAVAVAMLATAACSGSTEPSSEVTELTVILANSTFTENLPALAETYKAETGITVNVEAYGNEQLNDTLKVKLNAQSDEFDIFGYQVQDVMREFVRNGWLTDISDYVNNSGDWDWNDFQESARDAVQLDGKVYGVPVATERHIMYYRADLLKEAGIAVPTTIDELEAAAKALHNPDKGFYGIAMRGARVPLVTQYSSFLYSYGGDFQDEAGNSTINSEAAVQAYNTYGRLLHNYGPPGATNMGWVEASAIFAQGNAAFYLDADSQAYTFLDPQKSAVVDQVAYARFPAGPAGSHPYNIVFQTLGINSFSQKKDAAFDFIKWVLNKDNAKLLLGEHTLPVARSSAWQDSSATEKFPAGLVEIVRDTDSNYVGHDRPQLEAVARAREFVGGPAVTAIEGGDEAAVKAAAEQANTEFQALLDTEKR
ncbi:MAG: sugar ABC transporter substrate-binding protein [Propionicimonas sp.]|uniref:ABC transporter substrate-binding protein n=1 Tax=Propionicimonas sp. TaxID=1955623 RepID=UPI002B208058|nr:sugar ABC transporter substrate-binding protein [Propionicimonas sp.]MEA4944394.1 sugar ABC transporter substrate-binding protein [Propionicimonas sp.]